MENDRSLPSREAQLERLMGAYGDGVTRVCCLYLRDRALAQDAAQETFVRAWHALDRVRADGNERAYLMRIAANVCRNLLRSRAYRAEGRSTPLDAMPEAGKTDEYSDSTVLQAVLALPDRYRECVILHYYQEFSVEEVARILRLPRPTVSTRLRRAREKLRDRLKGWYFDEDEGRT